MAKRQGVVEGLPNYGLTMATDIRERWKASLSQRLLEPPWGKVDFTALARTLSAIVYLAYHSSPNMAVTAT